MEFRFLGNSGLTVSAVSYGNWVTHGSQVEADQATACVRAALEAGITTFDTADTYANGRAETILGDALAAERRESLEILTKVFGATGPGGPNDSGLSRKHIHESINGSLARLQTNQSTSIRRTATTSPHRWRRRWRHSPMWCGPGRRSTSGSASGRPSSCGPVTRWLGT